MERPSLYVMTKCHCRKWHKEQVSCPHGVGLCGSITKALFCSGHMMKKACELGSGCVPVRPSIVTFHDRNYKNQSFHQNQQVSRSFFCGAGLAPRGFWSSHSKECPDKKEKDVCNPNWLPESGGNFIMETTKKSLSLVFLQGPPTTQQGKPRWVCLGLRKAQYEW